VATVNIEGIDHAWEQGSISVPQIRQLGGIPDGTEIIEVDVDDNTERTLREDEKVSLPSGKEYGKKVKFRRG
jgi:hypothetical protein